MPEAATFTITFAGTVSSNSTESLKNLWTRVAGI